MKSIFPSFIDGDLLKLVHLSNSFKILDGAKQLKAGDVCTSQAKIVSVVNSSEGKTVKVTGQVYHQKKAVIEVTAAFLYRGRFTDYENTFDNVEEPDYFLTLESDASVGVLQSKEWFEWIDENPLTTGASLVFRIRSQMTFQDRTSFKELSVSGDIFMRNQLKELVKVGYVDLQQENCKGNPVLAYLQRHATPQGLPVPLSNEGYTMTTGEGSTVFPTPLTNEPYSKISGDFNPIHINPYFSSLASLPGTIVHGMWTSAATRRYVESAVASGHPERVISYVYFFLSFTCIY
jgi:fatty acid synthase subunit alpha, fungi type